MRSNRRISITYMPAASVIWEHRCSQITDAAGIYVIEILRFDLIDSELESVFDAFPDLSPGFPRYCQHVGFEIFLQLLSKCDVQVLFQKVLTHHRVPEVSKLQKLHL